MRIIRQDNYIDLTLKEIPVSFWSGFPDVKGKLIFIKPNLVSPKTTWDKNSTTHVKVTELIIEKLIQEGVSKIRIGECGFKDQWDNTMVTTGYGRLMKKYPDLEIIPLQDGPNYHKFTLTRLDKYRSLFGVKFSDYLLESDVVINVPKMKVHNMAGMTGAIKNMMGTMIAKGNMHPRGSSVILQDRLADLYLLTSRFVDFIVMDGIVGQEYSEQCGLPVKSGVLLSGTDQWEIDVSAAMLMGISPASIPYLRYINPDFSEIKVPRNLIKQYELPINFK